MSGLVMLLLRYPNMLDGVMRGDAEAGTSGSLADLPASSAAIHLPYEALSSMLRRAVALLRRFL